jgi:hypothetical protein
MKLFQQRELRDAYLFAEAGGQALLKSKTHGHAYLIDHEMPRLLATARRFGMRYVPVYRAGKAGQHVLIVRRAFHRALDECATPELAL